MTGRTCSVEDCEEKYKAKGLCNTHYERQRLGLSLTLPIRQYETGERLCKAPDCDNQRACSADLCAMHYQRLRKRLNRYGLTHEQFEAMLTAQGGCCAICRTDAPKGSGGFHWCVDHDHATGLVRGILCGHCNQGIGMLQDNPVIIAAAFRYLTIS
jgi:hypothetical protein